MPAAAVIPAPLAYTKVVAVKELVVGYQGTGRGPGVINTRAPRRFPQSRPLNSGVLISPLNRVGSACPDLLL